MSLRGRSHQQFRQLRKEKVITIAAPHQLMTNRKKKKKVRENGKKKGGAQDVLKHHLERSYHVFRIDKRE